MTDILPHLLLVNENPADSQQLCKVLDSVAVRLTVVSSGLEAIEVLRNTRIDILVTGIAIGEFDSWRLTRLIRSGVYSSQSDIPIVIVTRLWCERITEVTAREFGINHLLTFEDVEHLPALVSYCLNGSCNPVRKARVLVIEDHQDNARLVSKILRDRFEVDLAFDGQEGLEVWQQSIYDLVLLDIMLPKISGEDLLEKILMISPDQPVVVMTAHGSVELAEKLMRRGAVDFVTKPFRAEQLRHVCELAARRDDYLISHAQFAERLDSVQKLQELLGNIIDSMPSILIAVDRHCVVTQWNQQAEVTVGLSANAALGQSLQELSIGQIEISEVQESIISHVAHEQSRVPHQTGEVTTYYDKTIYPLSETGAGGAVIRLDDVTGRVELEGRMIQAKKMASLGELVAGIAHEINNPLAGIMQNTQVVRNRLDPTVDKNRAAAEELGTVMETIESYHQQRGIFSRLDAIMESGARAAKIIETMLGFCHQGGSKLKPVKLADLLDKSLELAASQFSLKNKFDFKAIELVRDYASPLPRVNCDASQIQQVLINLLINGAQAMEQKAQRLLAQGEPGYRGRFDLRLRETDAGVQLEIEDNGPGIAAHELPRIFDPFFTTKKVGEGTGLGLFISYLIVTESHHGTMEVESSPSQGAKFIIHLPTVA